MGLGLGLGAEEKPQAVALKTPCLPPPPVCGSGSTVTVVRRARRARKTTSSRACTWLSLRPGRNVAERCAHLLELGLGLALGLA